MYERLITQCENDQGEALNAYDKLQPCLEAQKCMRTKLLTSKVTLYLSLARNQYPYLPPNPQSHRNPAPLQKIDSSSRRSQTKKLNIVQFLTS